jgi:hypothetical protein
MTPRTVRKLSDLEIDEISVVDRPANQHGLVAIAKRDEGLPMALWDENGDEVFEDELEHGMVVYDDDDNPLVYAEDGQDIDLEDLGLEVDDSGDLDDEYDDEPELEPALAKALGYSEFGKAGLGRRAQLLALKGGIKGRDYARTGRGMVESYGREARSRGGRRARQAGMRTAMTGRAYPWTTAGITGAGGAGAGVAGGRRSKKAARDSLGDGIYGALSKAMSAEDARSALRDVADQIGEMLATSTAAAEHSYRIAKSLADERESETWMQVADGYELPVDPRVLGGVLKRAGRVLPRSDVAVLDRIFKAAGEANYFAEQGINAPFSAGGTHDMIEAAAMELVGKADGTTREQAVTALYAANPAAYDEYLREQAERW